MTASESTQFNRARAAAAIKLLIPATGWMVTLICLLATVAQAGDVVDAAKHAETAVDTLARKDVVWLALAAAIAASASSIVQTVLLFKITFAGVKAIDRIAARPCQRMENPWSSK